GFNRSYIATLTDYPHDIFPLS
ncbi:MAG: hypothetical protein QOE18_150, partial [Chloroflexota bacterium]|nr:hypothetical protein [Chloroflexota bacterium]